MIVVDGRTDEEKLRELLAAGTEQLALDFKATLDLSQKSSADVLHLVKDCVAMGNLPSGGYIVAGVDDTGKPAHDQAPLEVKHFDSADLRARVARYTEAQVHLVAQPHVVDGRDVVLIYVAPNPDGLPVPFSAIGQYQDENKKMQTVFSQGEVVVREGTSNVRLRYAHWPSLLQQYRAQVRAEATQEGNATLAQFVSTLREASGDRPAGAVTVPLVVGMDWDSFDEALTTHLEAENTVRVQKFLRTAAEVVAEHLPGHGGSPTEPSDQYEGALDAIAVVAINGAQYGRDDIYNLAIDALSDTYEAGGRTPTFNVGDIGSDPVSTHHWLAVIERVLAIGRAVVARKQWHLLPQPVYRYVPVADKYGYESWIRHAHIAAARNNLLPDHGGNLLSAVRQMLSEKPWLRPDLASPAGYTPKGQIDPTDQLLNQLTEFDLWWCVMAATRYSGSGGSAFYPSCAAFHEYRSRAAIDTIATDEAARAAAFPGVEPAAIAKGLATVITAAVQESNKSGGWWDGAEPGSPAATFINQYDAAPSDW
jgi:hypothetical protein